MALKATLKELQNSKTCKVTMETRCARAPKDFDLKKKGATIYRDDGATVFMVMAEGNKFKVDTMEMSDVKVGDKILAKAGSSGLGSEFWPIFEVMKEPTEEK